MKRLLLLGGRPWLARDGGRELVETLFRSAAPDVRVGMCIFAQPESDWQDTQAINHDMFVRFAGSSKVEVRVMTPENFASVSAWANIIYIPGGTTALLKKRLAPFNIVELWDGKTIAGASAGAHLLCAGAVHLKDRTIVKGLGWVHANVIVHWRSAEFEGFTSADWDWAEKALVQPAGKLPLICIQEDKFVEVSVG